MSPSKGELQLERPEHGLHRSRSRAMHRDPVHSSSLNSVGYDPKRQILEVEFADGDVYQYFDVPRQTYEAFLQAESVGQYMNCQIKQRHRYRRLE
ncbi:MAG: KTSC domain-containing protein [Reyranellaceae bacterium]